MISFTSILYLYNYIHIILYNFIYIIFIIIWLSIIYIIFNIVPILKSCATLSNDRIRRATAESSPLRFTHLWIITFDPICYSLAKLLLLLFSHSVVSDSLWPHGFEHARLPCPSPSPRACSNSCPLSQWCHPTISSSVIPFSSCLQSFPA